MHQLCEVWSADCKCLLLLITSWFNLFPSYFLVTCVPASVSNTSWILDVGHTPFQSSRCLEYSIGSFDFVSFLPGHISSHFILHGTSFALCHGKRKASEIQLALEDSRPDLGAGMFQSGRHLGSTQKGISSCGAGAGSVTPIHSIHSGAPTQLEHWTFGTGGKCWSVSHLLSSLCGTTGHWWDHPRSAVWWLAWTFCSFTGGCHRFLDSRADLRRAKRTGRASSWFSGQSSWWCSCSNCQWCRSEFDGETPTCPSRAMAEVIPMPCFGFGRWGTCPVSCHLPVFSVFWHSMPDEAVHSFSQNPLAQLHCSTAKRENSTKAYRNRLVYIIV